MKTFKKIIKINIKKIISSTLLMLAGSAIFTMSSFAAPTTTQAINFAALSSKTYGDAAFVVSATSDSGLTVNFTATGSCNSTGTNGSTITITAAGSCTVHADQVGDMTYLAAPTVSQSFSINKINITVSGGDFLIPSKTYNGTNIAKLQDVPTGYSFTGVINSDIVLMSTTTASATFANKNVGTSTKVATLTGFTLTGTHAGNYNLTNQPANEVQDVTAAPVTITPSTSFVKVYDTNISSTGTPAVTTGTVFTGDTSSFIQSFATAAAGTSKTINATGTINDGNSGLNYIITFSPVSDASIIGKSLTVSGLTANNKVYDATTAATTVGAPILSGVLSGDTVVIGGSIVANFMDKNIGAAKVVNVTGLTISGTSSANYTLNQPTLSADITVKNLNVTGLSAVSSTYNGTTVATLIGTSLLNGVVSADMLNVILGGSPVASFSNKNVGTAKLVAISGLNITGSEIANYSLIAPTSTATITTATLNILATGVNKTYDANNSASVTYSDNRISGDVFVVSAATTTFLNKNVANSKPVTASVLSIIGLDATNYTISSSTIYTTANITKKNMTASVTASNKVYDANTSASTTISSSGIISGDVITFNKTSSTFADKNVASAKLVTVGGVTISGTDAGNYSPLNATATTNADITAKNLIVNISAANKVYDGSNVAAISSISSNVISGDVLGALGTASSTFSDKNVGTVKVVTANVVISFGADNINYIVPATATTTANITARTLNMISASGTDKVYNGSVNGIATISDNRVLGDIINYIFTTSTFADKNVGNTKVITVSGITISGTDSTNYILSGSSIATPANVKITPATATIMASSTGKVFGSTDPVLTYITTGIISGDTLTGSLSRVAGENVGAYNILQNTLSAGANYVTSFATGTFIIVKANQNITISPVANKNPSDVPFSITATTTSGLSVALSVSTSSACTISGNTIALTGATGTCQVIGNQAGDANYNAATSTSIVINIIDTIAPIITLNGSSSVSLFVGIPYNELGANVYDFMSGTTTATISGDIVNTAVAATYIVKYNATDTSSNIAIEKIRTVIVASNAGLLPSVSGGGGSGGSFGAGVYFNNITNAINTNVSGLQVLGVSKFKFNKNLSLGSKNNDVKELQKYLKSEGLYTGEVTGIFDKATRESVIAFQKENKIKPTIGIFGALTRAVINKK